MDVKVYETQQWLNSTYGNIAGFEPVMTDGITGNSTFKALIRALQYEIGLTNLDGAFGEGTITKMEEKYPTLSASQNPQTTSPINIIYILQGAFWCKGYSPGGFTGVFGESTTSAVKKFQSDAGITQDGIIKPYILQGIMNTDGYFFKETGDEYDNYKHLVQQGLNSYYGSRIGLTAPNGQWERKAHKNLIKAVQLEWGLTADGIWGTGTMNAAPMLSKNTSGYTNSKRLLQWALTINGFYPGGFTGTFGDGTYNAVYNFQNFLALGVDGIAGKNTWASLLKSCGNTARTATALDTATRLTTSTAIALKNAGYNTVGRYLVNVNGGTLDKKMTAEELQIMANAGLKVFPIFQTIGNKASYFTPEQAVFDAASAKNAAKEFGFPIGTVIYFAVDYDVLTADIDSNIIPYFTNIKANMGKAYRIGVYGPRMVCTQLAKYNLAAASFVADMSSGFTGNIGQKMPDNWAYDQFIEVTECGIGIDKNIASPRATAVLASSLSPHTPQENIEVDEKYSVIKKLYNLVFDYFLERYSDIPTIYMANSRVLGFLRRSYSGLLWTITAGFIDTTYNAYVDEHYGIDYKTISIPDPKTGLSLDMSHYAATMQGLDSASFGIDVILSGLGQDVNAMTGWAGDLLQMAGGLKVTHEKTGINYFLQPEMLKKIIYGTPNQLSSYTFYLPTDSEKPTNYGCGFGWIDLCQDVDAYNIYNLYDLAETPLHEIFQDYYATKVNSRFSLFKQFLLSEYGKSSISDVADLYTKGDKLVSKKLSENFGEFDNATYHTILADAFQGAIEYLIANE